MTVTTFQSSQADADTFPFCTVMDSPLCKYWRVGDNSIQYLSLSYLYTCFQVDLQLVWEAFAVVPRLSACIHTILLLLCHQLLTYEEVVEAHVMELPFERLGKYHDNSSSQVLFR